MDSPQKKTMDIIFTANILLPKDFVTLSIGLTVFVISSLAFAMTSGDPVISILTSPLSFSSLVTLKD